MNQKVIVTGAVTGGAVYGAHKLDVPARVGLEDREDELMALVALTVAGGVCYYYM